MPFSSLLCASIELSINRLLSLDITSQQRISALVGKTIGVTVHELPQPLFFHFSATHIEVLGQYEGDLAAQLTVNLNTLLALKNNGSLSDLIKSDQLIINGDIKTLQAFADVFVLIDIDWQEYLSQYTGDVLAYNLGQGINKLVKATGNQMSKTKSYADDYLTQESRLLVSRLEFLHLSDSIDDLARQTEHLTHKITQLGNS